MANNGSYAKWLKVEYDPSFCDKVIDLMTDGSTLAEVQAKFKISSWKMRKWRKQHKEFDEAVKIGVDLGEAYWSRFVRDNMENRKINTNLVELVTGSRFGWSKKQQIDSSTELKIQVSYGDGGGPVGPNPLRYLDAEFHAIEAQDGRKELPAQISQATQVPEGNTRTVG